MENQEFNKLVRELNVKYRDIFGSIPCITDYSCTREEYLNAMKNAVEKRIPISLLLLEYQEHANYKDKFRVI